MSRRSRRRRGKPASKGAWWLRGLAVLLVVAAVAMGGGYLWLRSWLHSEEFRKMLSAEVGAALEAEAEFGEFQWEGTHVDTKSFDASGGALVGEVKAKGLSMDIGLGEVRQRRVLLRHARINEIEARLDLTGDAPAEPPKTDAPAEAPSGPAPWYERWVPNDFVLTDLTIGRSALHLGLEDGDIAFSGTGWEVEPGQAKGSYEIEGSGGTVSFPWEFVPELRLGEAAMRYQDGTVFLLNSDFRVYERGYATLTGEASAEGYSFDGTLVDVSAAEVIPEDWKQRLQGRIEADYSVAEVKGGPSVDGSLRLLDGVLTGLPVLESLGAYGGNPRFLRLTLSEATTDFLWENGNLTLSNLKIGSEGLMRVEGRLWIGADERIDGRFRVGLTPGTLARVPGAETKVFLPGERGLLWTDLHVTGTLDDPREDLTARLIEAAGMRMFEILPETGERVLKYTRRAVEGDVVGQVFGEEGVVDRGAKIIDAGKGVFDGEGDVIREVSDTLREGEDLVREVGGIFDFFKDEPEEDEQPERQPQ